MEDNLSNEQKIVIESKVKYKCVFAGAGSGKTKTLINQISLDIESGVNPENIIAFTFTNKAADEILNRVITHCKKHIPDKPIEGIFIGTIHSWCYNYLSEQKDFLNFTSLDELHEFSLISRLYDDLKLGELYNVRYPVGILKFLKDLEVFYNESIDEELLTPKLKKAIINYQKILIENKLMNFGSMIKNAIINLKSTGGLPKLSRLYVDEYQDVNPSQVELIKLMLNENCKLMVVGDDLQCIYNWRGSDVNRILNFNKDFSDSETFILKDNYRSLPYIVNAGNVFSTTILNRYKQKTMEAKRVCENKQEIIHYSSNDEFEQAKQIVECVNHLVNNGYKYNEIAILLRSVNSSGKEIIDEFENNNIPIESPLGGRAIGFEELFIIPILEWINQENGEPKNQKEEDLIAELSDKIYLDYLNFTHSKVSESEFWKAVNSFKRVINSDSNEAYNVRKYLYVLLEQVRINIDVKDNELMVAMGIISQIIRSVEEIHRRRLRNRSRKNIHAVIKETIQAIRYNFISFGESHPIDYNINGVTLTTVHQAKGLEWPVVILPYLNKNKFPLPSRNQDTSFADAIAGRYGTTEEDERRLFYVAITRAKDRVILLDTVKSTKKPYSVFLEFLMKNGCTLSADYADSFWYKEASVKTEKHVEPVRVGLSDLLVYLECPFQYGLRRKVEIQPAIGDELGYGKGLHEIIQRRFLDKTVWTNDQLNTLVDENVIIPYQSEKQESESKKSIIQRYRSLEKHGLFKYDILPEEKIELIYENGIIDGIIDGVINNEDGSISIVDWKSNVHEKYLNRYERQIEFYAFALSERGYNVKDVRIVDIGATHKSGKLVEQLIVINKDALTKIKELILTGIDGIISNDFHPNPSNENCSSCDMNKLCAYYKK